jgi:hypothetical protein
VQLPLAQIFEVQSAAAVQTFPATHGPQLPPQSTSVSVPFLTASEQESGAQVSPAHTREEQSAAERHVFPGEQGAQLVPPQSMSVSVPFLAWSEQVGCASTSCLGARPAPHAEASATRTAARKILA